MPSTETFNFIRIIPRESGFLSRRVGSRGELFWDRENNSLTLFDGVTKGGLDLARADLSNISDSDFAAKAASAGISASDGSSIAGSGSTSVTVGESLPVSPENGNLWLNTTNGALYVYIDDGDSEQWIQPAFPAFSGDYDDLNNKPTLPSFADVIGDPYVSGTYDFGANRILFANVYSSLGDLPDASTYHGMFAHVHATGKAYYAHAGNWVELADQSDIGVPATISSTILGDDSTLLVDTSTSELNTYALSQVSATDGQALLWNTSNSRWQPGDVSLGSFSFTGTNIDTTDSSAITVTPAITMQSDLTVENDLVTERAFITDLTLTGEISSQGSGTPEIVSDNEINLDAGTRVDLTTGPIRMARFTTAQRDALVAQNGDVIYNTTLNKFQGYENGSWTNLI